ncbi:fibropellin-3 [Strongylocentrotus purpuratus]|uniref:EGF-like domain-containing protein n=1 Tax=Strongylocentrotus purpuratus TaxID=7668 RepID=A0A7M7NQA4_STRPU|nr:fibropellin-3 [Strongylocentrotus purpuratus]
MGHLRSVISLLILSCMIAPSLQCIHLFKPQVTVTPCSSEPCLNGAECFDDEVDHYACVCPTGFTGTNCEIENSCSSNPCLNGACSPLEEGFTCQCEPGYRGVNCQIADPCFSNPCLNDGECAADNDGGAYTCYCEDAFTGVNCETPIVCPNNMVFNQCALFCGPARCGVVTEECIAICDPKCDCPHTTMLCPEQMLPLDTCVSNCTECYDQP